MSVISPERRAASRRNGQKSQGPTTPAGKQRSRANALKHGMTGTGVVLTDDDPAEAQRRCEALEQELKPSGELGRILVRRIAVHSVRMDRCVRHEAAMNAERVRNAEAEYDDRRLAAVEKAFDWLAGEPATSARRLRQSPEGLDMLIRAWEGLADDLNAPYGPRWSYAHSQ